MAYSFLPAIDISLYDKSSKGLNAASLSYIGGAFTIIAKEQVNEAFAYLQKTLGVLDTHFDVTALASIEDIVALLDAGAAKVFVSKQQLEQLSNVENIDPDRLALVNAGLARDEIVDTISETSVGIYAPVVDDPEFLEAWLKEYGTERPEVYASLTTSNIEHVRLLARCGAIPVVPAEMLTTDPKNAPDLIDVGTLLLENVTSDRPDGLFTTLVTDERGVALGLVYSSAESISESLRTGKGVYQSRKRGLWYKGETSGDTQEVVRISMDCDRDCVKFIVRQRGRGFCHLATATCFGQYKGLSRLQKTLEERKTSAPNGSYTARLFNDTKLLRAKILEEANELCDAQSKNDVAWEAADLLYFALTKCVAAGVSLEDVERNLDAKSVKVKRRKGDAKVPLDQKNDTSATLQQISEATNGTKELVREAASVPKSKDDKAGLQNGKIQMTRYNTSTDSPQAIREALQRPSQRSTETIMGIVNPIVKDIRSRGDAALLEYTHKFEKATSLSSPVINAPYPEKLMELSPKTRNAIDTSFENIRRFHAAQKEEKPLTVETMPGVLCSRFARPIERVGLYVPGGTAVLPSSALMLGVPAMVAGCKKIVLASPPRKDGTVTPEIVYVAEKVGAESIVLAGGAQAIAAMAYGTEKVSKVDKILGPGNQFVTAAKMIVSNDTTAGVSIDMPAGPSEVLVVADASANPAFVASDLLSQAEHGVDSQVVLIAVGLDEDQLAAIEDQLHSQANALPRVDIVRGAIAHSVTVSVKDIAEAMDISNYYAPEHLILQVKDAEKVVPLVQNAGSVFVGQWTPESVGDYSAGVNHSLPTYGYAKQYSGVNLGSYVKHITSSNLTKEGLKNVGPAVMQLAKVEELEAHRRAVSLRLGVD